MKKKIIYALAIFAVIAFLVALDLLIMRQKEYKDAKAEYDKIAQNVCIDHGEVLPLINFEVLENPDTVGWLYMPNIGISYPVVQRDNSYYLNHTYKGRTNIAGAIFMDSRCSIDSSPIIYGHNMKDGSMFGLLSHCQVGERFYYYDGRKALYTCDIVNCLVCEKDDVEKLANSSPKLLTLSTCTSNDSKRFIVQAIMSKKDYGGNKS